MSKFKDAEHLVRLAVAVLVVGAIFVLIRAHFIPKSFGEYGHYRGNSLTELAEKPVAYAGHQACADCHGDIVDLKKTGKHAGINCETCHGPLAKHAADPTAVVPELPDTAVICARCHEAGVAKPKTFPQVVSAEHSGGVVCKTCHQPHNPLQQPEGKS